MSDTPVKQLTIKYIGTNKPADQLNIEPGTRVSDVLTSLGLSGGHHLVDTANADLVYRPQDDLYARIDGDSAVLAVTAQVDAGTEAAA